jgi:LysM repeat protein
MAGRSPVRFLAPLALVAVVIALFMVVSSSRKDPGTSSKPGRTSSQSTASPSGKGSKSSQRQRKGPRRYTVKSGDTPSSIADKTGIPLEQILRLNPDLDPQSLSPGERIKLRQ